MLYMKDRGIQGKEIKGVEIHVACLDASSGRVSVRVVFRNIPGAWRPKGGILVWYACVSCGLGVPTAASKLCYYKYSKCCNKSTTICVNFAAIAVSLIIYICTALLQLL